MDLKNIYQNIIDGNNIEIGKEVMAALEAGADPEEILKSGLIAAMKEVGNRFEEGDLFVPEMLVSARAMQVGLKILKPHLAKANVKAVGKVAMGTVKSDLHDIGKNLVAMMLEGAGFEVVDLGVDVAPEAFVKAAQNGIQLLGMSALLTTTMSNMETTMQALNTAGVRKNVKVMIGGAPVTQEYAKKIGADGFAADASSATRIALQLLG
ncbi:MAG: methyltransferase [Chloroflexi bacterium GWB2_49_20]|nr:MAG: methyltransferase [Chloroflexi bacterium GWB2_49_20]OGN79719.1 MAG: methyltransferase [Chloroflexi bacterium GWC2_49_37]OGN85967.1 MAG: methyltransferase [Chloroflexi bacterium GWD2_49_16]HBG73972.1 cobalamin-binding protein [Anaerolineae bacterium]HCC78762.1 cobalamin-binding protein [Anaerolineae bacterium]